jgi:hypothetical protein
LEIAEWVAPAATMIAAIMTAANLGSRVTGWGFAVFAVGAVAWILVGIANQQQNLVISNGFLLVVDIVGIWRWLGQRARYDTGASVAAERSHRAAPLMPLSKLEGMAVHGHDDAVIATVVDAMARCGDGRIAYLVVRQGGLGGVGETLHAIDWSELRAGADGLRTRLDKTALEGRGAIDPEAWPERPPVSRAG